MTHHCCKTKQGTHNDNLYNTCRHLKFHGVALPCITVHIITTNKNNSSVVPTH